MGSNLRDHKASSRVSSASSEPTAKPIQSLNFNRPTLKPAPPPAFNPWSKNKDSARSSTSNDQSTDKSSAAKDVELGGYPSLAHSSLDTRLPIVTPVAESSNMLLSNPHDKSGAPFSSLHPHSDSPKTSISLSEPASYESRSVTSDERVQSPPFTEDVQSVPTFPPLNAVSKVTVKQPDTCWNSSRTLFAKPNPAPTTVAKTDVPSLSVESQKRRPISIESEPKPSSSSSLPNTELLTSPVTSEGPANALPSAWDVPLYPKLGLGLSTTPTEVSVASESVVTEVEEMQKHVANETEGMQPELSRATLSPTASGPASTMLEIDQRPWPSASSVGDTGTLEDDSQIGSENGSQKSSENASQEKSAPAESQSRTSQRDTGYGESLWKHPLGADVIVYTDTMVYHIHRDIVTHQSAWFEENLDDPNPDGSAVPIFMPHTDGAVVHCLRFMYTHRIEICEYNRQRPLNMMHLPRCVLAYAAAKCLKTNRLVTYLVRIVEETASHLKEGLANQRWMQWNEDDWNVGFAVHLHHAILITYEETAQDLMEPMRMALAAVVDASLSHLIGKPGFVAFVASVAWQRHGPAVSDDLVRFRQRISTL